MKLTIESRGVGESWGHRWHDISQAYGRGGDVIITFGNQGSITISSDEFENYKRNAILFVRDKLKPIDSTVNIQENDAIMNRMFMSLVDSKYKVCNVAYRLNQSY